MGSSVLGNEIFKIGIWTFLDRLTEVNILGIRRVGEIEIEVGNIDDDVFSDFLFLKRLEWLII